MIVIGILLMEYINVKDAHSDICD